MKNHIYEFVVAGGGDRSVGIPDVEAEITIKTNVVFELHDIEDVKDSLALIFDVPKGCIGTKEEYEKYCQEEREAFFAFCDKKGVK